jgi:hypothetical protein
MVASNPAASPEILRLLSEDGNDEVVMYVANNSALPIDLAKSLSAHQSSLVRSSIACNENTPQDILSSMLDDKDEDVICELSRNNNSPISLLKKLALSKNKEILEGVARNLSSNSDILDYLSKCKIDSVREAVAEHVNTSPSVLGALCNDVYDVRLRVAGNVSTPITTLQILLNDKDKYIKESVINNPAAKLIIKNSDKVKTKKFDINEVAKNLFEAFNSDGGLIVDADSKKKTVLMLRSGSSIDKQYTLSIETTRDHEEFETISTHFISLDEYEDSINEFKMAIDLYLKNGGSKSSLDL